MSEKMRLFRRTNLREAKTVTSDNTINNIHTRLHKREEGNKYLKGTYIIILVNQSEKTCGFRSNKVREVIQQFEKYKIGPIIKQLSKRCTNRNLCETPRIFNRMHESTKKTQLDVST